MYSPLFIKNSYLLIPLSSSWAVTTAVILFVVEDVDIFIDKVISLALNIAYKVISVSPTVNSVNTSFESLSVFHPAKS